jgi:diacylglycerol kinase family enzyme
MSTPDQSVGALLNRVLVIINPMAGRGRAVQAWPQVAAQLVNAGILYDDIRTRRPHDAMTLAEHAVDDYDVVIAVGGDGTAHEVANGLLAASNGGPTKPMAVIPLGRSNDFTRLFTPDAQPGSKPIDPAAAIQLIARRATRSLDVARVISDVPHPLLGDAPLYMINALTVGLGAHLIHGRDTAPRYYSDTSVAMLSMGRAVLKAKSPVIALRVNDGMPISLYTPLVAVMNGRCAAGTFWMAPLADPMDGKLEVYTTPDMNRLNLVTLVPRLMKGTHHGSKPFTYQQARRVTLIAKEPLAVEIDGELSLENAHRLEVEVLPGALTIIG